MKKNYALLIALLFVLTVAGCQREATSTVVISKLFDATSQSNNAIELYNNSDEEEDLSNYVLNFYTNGAAEVSKTIELTGTIPANDYYVISGNTTSNDAIIAASDFQYSEGSLPFNGNDAIELVKRNTVIDFMGYVGYDITFSQDLTLIRTGEKEDYTPTATYNEFNFIAYVPDLFFNIKNDQHAIKTVEQLLAGPQLEERYKSMPYVDEDNDSIGGGGAVVTTNTGIADGDTAYFSALNGYPGGSLRYFYLNTPEVNGGFVNAEPWGYVASKYNKEYLLVDHANKEIRIQSIPGYSLNEGYGRNLGLVWIEGALSQFLIISEGLTEDVGSTYNSYDLELTYQNVPYLTFFRFAEQRARENGWGLHGYPTNPDGEKAPDWNYQSNSLATNTPVWTPHLPLPWEA